METQITCPECGAQTEAAENTIFYHLRPDNLAACEASRTQLKGEAPPKARKATKKAPAKRAKPKA